MCRGSRTPGGDAGNARRRPGCHAAIHGLPSSWRGTGHMGERDRQPARQARSLPGPSTSAGSESSLTLMLIDAAMTAVSSAGRPEPGLVSCYPNWACVMRARQTPFCLPPPHIRARRSANRPGGHDRRSTRPAPSRAPHARERLAGAACGHHPRWDRLRDRSPRPDGDASRRADRPRRLPCHPPIPRRRKVSPVRARLASPTMPGRWLLPLGAGSQPRLNLPVPLTAQPPPITGGSVPR
jgi:hypothetical protein